MEEERSILVNIPDNLQIKNIIDSVARFVATEGIEFEKVIAEKEKMNPKFEFLRNLNSDEGTYYRWRTYAYVMGDNDQVWEEKPFRPFSQIPLLIVPPFCSANMSFSFCHPHGTQLIPDKDYRSIIEDEKVHVFIDYSNIIIGSKIVFGLSNINYKDELITLIPSKLDELVISSRKSVEKHIYGSISRMQENVENCWKELNYHAAFSVRTGRHNNEKFVDDVLVSQMNSSILKYKSLPGSPRILVLLTGDGNENFGRASFLDSVNFALREGWKVELWAWQSSLNKKYIELQESHEKFTIYFLDDWRHLITARYGFTRE